MYNLPEGLHTPLIGSFLIRQEPYVDQIRRFLFGNDAFVSYGRADATNYALAIASRLAKEGLSCYIDQWGAPPGSELPAEVISALRRSTIFVLIGSPAAGMSDSVEKEIREFLLSTRTTIPVSFGDSITMAKWFPLVKGLTITTEPSLALETGQPSETTITRIVNAEGFVTRNQRLRRLFWATAMALIVLVVTGIMTVRAFEKRRVAAEMQAEAAEKIAADAGQKAEHAQEDARAAIHTADDERARATQRRYVAIAERLASDAPGQQGEEKFDERAVLMVRQAFLFNQANGGDALSQVDAGLRAVLSAPALSLDGGKLGGPKTALAFDSRSLVIGYGEGPNQVNLGIRRFPASSQIQPYLIPSKSRVGLVALSPDGRNLAYSVDRSGDRDELRLMTMPPSRSEPTVFPGLRGHLRCLAFSPSGQLLVAGGEGGSAWVWSVSGEPKLLVAGLSADGGAIGAAAISKQDDLVALGSVGGSIWTVELKVRSPQPEFVRQSFGSSPEGGHSISALAFTPDGTALVSGEWLDERTKGPVVLVWQLRPRSLTPRPIPYLEPWPESLAFTPDGGKLIAGSVNGPLHVWDYRTPDMAPLVIHGHHGTVNALAVSSDGSHFASADFTGNVRIWSLQPPPAEPRSLEGYRETVMSVAFGRGRGILAAADYAGRIRIWNLKDPTPSPTDIAQSEGQCVSVALSSDEAMLAAGYQHDFEGRRAVRVWDLRRSYGSALIPPGGETWADSVGFSSDGSRLAWGTEDGIAVWNVRTPGDQPKRFTGNEGRVKAVVFDPNGGIIVTGGYDGTVRAWDLATGANHIIDRGKQMVETVAWSRDGVWLARGDSSGTIKLWKNWKEVRNWYAHDGAAHEVVFSVDGSRLVSAGNDGTVRVWSVENPVLPVVLRTNGAVMSSDISSDGQIIAAGGVRGSLSLVPASTDKLAGAVCTLVTRNLTATEWQAWIGTDIPYECTCPAFPAAVGTCSQSEKARKKPVPRSPGDGHDARLLSPVNSPPDSPPLPRASAPE